MTDPRITAAPAAFTATQAIESGEWDRFLPALRLAVEARIKASKLERTKEHTCHWPDCKTPVPPKMWGCKPHWFSLPKRHRDAIWATYRPGQEIDKRPSAEYLEAARAVQDWIRGSKSNDD